LLTPLLILILPIISGNSTDTAEAIKVVENNKVVVNTIFKPIKAQQVIDEEIDCLARNIYFEARSLSTAGKMAVAQVTLNRVKNERFPATICDVVYEGRHYFNSNLKAFVPQRNRCQFSWYCDGKSDAIQHQNTFKDITTFAHYFVNDYYNHDHADITDGALWYHADYMKKFPKWSKTRSKVAQIDVHLFYK